MKIFNERFPWVGSGDFRQTVEVSVCGIPVGIVFDVIRVSGGIFKKRIFNVDVFVAIPKEYTHKQRADTDER